MLIFLIGEVGALAYIATEIEVTSKYVETTLYDSIMLYNTSVTVTKAWDTYQAKVKVQRHSIRYRYSGTSTNVMGLLFS